MAALIRVNPRLLASMQEMKDEAKNMLTPIFGYEKEDLLDLEQACEPLKSIFDEELSEKIKYAKLSSEEPTDNLTQNESASIRLYTAEWDDHTRSLYMVLNHTLRGGDREKLRPWFKYMKLLLTAFFKLPPMQHQTVWRGVGGDLSNDYKKGKEQAWWAFTSTTASCNTLDSASFFGAEGVRTMFSIETTSGRSIRSHSDFLGEDEILLPPGLYFKVISQMQPVPGKLYIIHLREIEPPYQLLASPFESASTEKKPSNGNATSQSKNSVPKPNKSKQDPARLPTTPKTTSSLAKVAAPVSTSNQSTEPKAPITYDIFEQSIGDIKIDDKGYVAVRGSSLNSGEVRGKQEYSSGKHQLRFKIENNSSRMLIAIGIISKSTSMKPNSYMAASFHGWASYNQYYVGGVLEKKGDIFSDLDNRENDIIELIIDATSQVLQYTNERTKQTQKMMVDIKRCPFPWQLQVSVVGDEDRVRLLTYANLS